jgi:hypothetical protein
VTYDLTYPNHDGLFAVNGLSSLSNTIGLHVNANAMPGVVCPDEPVQLQASLTEGTEGVSFTWSSLPEGFTSDLQNPVANPMVSTSFIVHAFDGLFHARDTVDVVVTDANPLADTIWLRNITVPVGMNKCYNAFQTITVAGEGSVFVLHEGSNVHMISGQHIRLLPGTRSFPGSFLHAYITSAGEFCCWSPPTPAMGQDVSAGGNLFQSANVKPFFNVFPNPTSGTFTIELTNVDESAKVSVEIYGILGELILKTEMAGAKQKKFDLQGRQPGVYLIRVLNDAEIGLKKIIKQ